MIHTSLSPNTESDDLWLAAKNLFLPWNWFFWKNGKKIRSFEAAFEKYLDVDYAISFQRGRDALLALLKSLKIGSGSEVILQGYTCIVVPNAIRYAGAKPIYVDIAESGFNTNLELIEKAITNKTRAILVQHSFGEAVEMEELQALCKKKKILLVEDCAHALSSSHQGEKLGSSGDAAIWSFGRDKIISSVWGGMVTTDREDIAEALKTFRYHLSFPSWCQIAQALFHPLFFAFIKPFYRWKIGRGLIYLAQRFKFIPKVIFPAEKLGKCPRFFPQKMPNVLAKLAHHQLKKLDCFHQHRLKCAKYYHDNLQNVQSVHLPEINEKSAWLRYTIRTKNAQDILKSAQKNGIYLGDWYRSVLAPEGCKLESFGYEVGTCPNAEKAAEETINLPTHIQMDENKMKEVVGFVKNYLQEKED
jgi:perosamine synthetase